MEALQIRPARLNDIDGIREVAVETWNSTYETIYPEHFIATFLNHAYSKSSLEHSITRDEADPARKFLVAEPGWGNCRIRTIERSRERGKRA